MGFPRYFTYYCQQMWFSIITILNGNGLSLCGFLHSNCFFGFFSSCLGIYDRTGCNRQDKTIHHAGLMWESKFNLVSLIYKYWPSREHIEHIYLSTKPGYILCPTNFSGLRFRGRVFQCFRLCRLLRVLLGVGERGYIFSSSPRSHSFDGILMTVHFLSVFISIFINE